MNAVVTRVRPYVVSVPALTAVLTVLSAAGVLAGPPAAAVPGGLLLGFVLPGLALTALIFRNRTLTAVERTVLAPALSLAVLIIAGLILYVAAFPLDRTSWTLAAAGVTLAVLGLKAVPERVWTGEDEDDVPPPAPAAPEPPPPGPFAPWGAKQKVKVRLLAGQLAPMVLVVVILAGAGYLSWTSSHHNYDVTVTTLSATPPTAAGASGRQSVTVSATGLLAGDGPYDLLVTGPGGRRVLDRRIPAGNDGTWSATLDLPAAGRLTVSLFRAGDSTAYRTLYLAAQQ